MRTANTCAFTSLAASDARNTASGALVSGVIRLAFSTRARSASLVTGMALVIRLQADGAIQLERTL
ncbi:hypothetical protein D3C72_2566860 [compost metagenome]